jgi:hypothetical protein
MDVSVVAAPEGVGKIASDGRDFSATVNQDLIEAGVPQAEILRSSDQERIVFLTEKQAFPVRFIPSLKHKYDAYPFREALHIDKRSVPKPHNLFLESAADRPARRDTEEGFLLGRAYGGLTVARNANSGRSEIRMEFDGGLGMRGACSARTGKAPAMP